jgi:hypothetical protein
MKNIETYREFLRRNLLSDNKHNRWVFENTKLICKGIRINK